MSASPDAIEALARTALLVRRDIYPSLDEAMITGELVSTAVTLSASRSTLSSAAGQTAVVTAAIVAAQLGVTLHLDFEETALVVPQPPLRGEGLRESLLDLTADLITPALIGGDGEFNVAVGCSPRGPGVALSGDDFAFELSADGGAGSFVGGLPFGAGLGAAGCGAEVFRHVMRRVGRTHSVDALAEHSLEMELPARRSLPPFTWAPCDLGRVDSISGGALATALLYLLLRVPGLAMQLRLIDGDIGALSNLNRYLLLSRCLLDMPKVDALATFATNAISIEPVPFRFDDRTEGRLVPLAPIAVVGVDDIPSRWRAQRAASGWLGVAATSHFEVVVSEHTTGSPCAACLHPRDDDDHGDIPTVSFVSAFSGFLLSYRLARFGIDGAMPSQTLAYPFGLSRERAVWDLQLSARADCKVGCEASRTLSASQAT